MFVFHHLCIRFLHAPSYLHMRVALCTDTCVYIYMYINNCMVRSWSFPIFLLQHSILKPFMLRRVKKDVETEMTGKKELAVDCQLSTRQHTLYRAIKDKISVADIFDGAGGQLNEKKVMHLMNIVIQLRKVLSEYKYNHYIQSYNPTFILSYYHTIIQSYICTIIQSFNHSIIQSFNHTIIESFNHTILQSYDQTILQSHNHIIT